MGFRSQNWDAAGTPITRTGLIRDQTVPVALSEVKYGLNPDIKTLDQQLARYFAFLSESIDQIADDISAILSDKIAFGLFAAQKGRQAALETLNISRKVSEAVICINLVNFNPNSTLFADVLPRLRALPFFSQIRVFHSDFAIWSQNEVSLK